MSEIRSSKKETFNLKVSSLTLFIITVTWTLGSLQSIFVWGLAIPFGVVMIFIIKVVDAKSFEYILNFTGVVTSRLHTFCNLCA